MERPRIVQRQRADEIFFFLQHFYMFNNWKLPVLSDVKCMCRFILKKNRTNPPQLPRSASRYLLFFLWVSVLPTSICSVSVRAFSFWGDEEWKLHSLHVMTTQWFALKCTRCTTVGCSTEPFWDLNSPIFDFWNSQNCLLIKLRHCEKRWKNMW